ncbi:MAG: primosomal protein N' [Candidatus Paceibacterota bacterium]|jgi:primosomal protein N'
MKLLEVVPIAKGINKDTLSYFSVSDIPIGSIIKVPLRKRVVPALVINAREVKDSKSEIKNSSFALKKIAKAKFTNLLTKNFVDAAEMAANYYIGTIGSVLNSIIPKTLLENIDKIKLQEINFGNANPGQIKSQLDGARKNTRAEKFVIQSTDDDRYAQYKSIIREEFAKGSSVFFCLPTIQDIKKAKESLHKGIEMYTFVLHSSMNKKDIVETVNKILSEKHSVLVIGTGGFLSIPKNNIGTIILDKENSRSYKMQIRPYIDMRKFAEVFAEKINSKIIFGDLLLRTDTIWRQKRGELVELVSLKFRSLTTSSQEIIDMRSTQKDINETIKTEENKKVFRIFSEKLEKKIKENIENNEHMFIFTGRRGLSPSTVCADCGNVVKCNSCGAHTVLHKSTNENFFLCHKCGERRNALEKCSHCGGWRLTTLGIGSEMVEEKMKELYPKASIFRIDADATPTHNRAQAVAEKFYNSPEGILVGTEMALLYLTEKIENTAVVSIDSFFSIPDFRINERILNILLKIRSITDKYFIIQTRDIKQKVFEYAVKGNLVDFYRDEINDREKLHFPPFTTLIKISIAGTKEEVLEMSGNIQKIIEPHIIDIFPAFIPQSKGKYGVNGIIKIPGGKWPDKELCDKLKILPIDVLINVDPDSLI